MNETSQGSLVDALFTLPLSLSVIFLMGLGGIFLLFPHEPSNVTPDEKSPITLPFVLGVVFAGFALCGLLLFCQSPDGWKKFSSISVVEFTVLLTLQMMIVVLSGVLILLRLRFSGLLLFSLLVTCTGLVAILEQGLLPGIVLFLLGVSGGVLSWRNRERLSKSQADPGSREPFLACLLGLLFGVVWVGVTHGTLIADVAPETKAENVLLREFQKIHASPGPMLPPSTISLTLVGMGVLLGMALLPLWRGSSDPETATAFPILRE